MFSSSCNNLQLFDHSVQEAERCTLPWSCLRPKHNIFHFQESVKGHLLVEFKIFFQLSSRPTESVLNARRKGQQVNGVALKKLFLEMTRVGCLEQPSALFLNKETPAWSGGAKPSLPPRTMREKMLWIFQCCYPKVKKWVSLTNK